MTTRRDDQPAGEEVRTQRGELRKPGDRSNQPGQGADLTPPDDGHMRDLHRDRAREPRVEPERPQGL